MNLKLKQMRGTEPVVEMLNRAFELAYFILGDRAASIYVAMAAMDKLKAASNNQLRRGYYTPTGRLAYPATRTKISLSDLHLLQRLVYVESELFERLSEGQANSLGQEDMIIRYVKHLVRITTKHNSFYVTLGLARLLYNYSTADTAEIYNLVIQDPERIRDDYYYRSRKKSLMREIKDRFGDLLKAQRGFRREERFQPQEDSQRFANLVKECLQRFTPWESACVLPSELDPDRNVISQLLFEGRDPDQEHHIELKRMHTLIHGDCFARVVAALGFKSPEQRLELPKFFVTGQGPRSIHDRFSPAALTDGELGAMTRYLDKNGRQRKQFSQRQMSLVIDGRRQSEFEIEPSREIVIDLGREPELIELRPPVSFEGDEDFPLAVSLLKYDRAGVIPFDVSVALRRDRNLSLKLIPQMDDDSGVALGASLRISETPPGQNNAIFSALREFQSFSFAALKPRRGLLIPAAVAVVIIAGILVLWRWSAGLRHPSGGADANHVAQLNDHPQPPELPKVPAVAPLEPKPSEKAKESAPPKHTRAATSLAEPDSGQVRAIRAKPISAQLRSIKAVYVDPLGDDSASQQLRDSLIARLRATDRFTVVTNRDDADAVFKGSVKDGSTSRAAVQLELINARGQVVWSLSTAGRGKALPRDPSAGSERIMQRLLRDVSKLK